MKVRKGLVTAVCTLSLCLAGCFKSDPGPLSGTWRMNGPLPMTVEFRPGETEALSIIEKVSYETRGSDVLVTYQDGIMKGTSMRYTMVDANTARSQLGTLSRVR